jgi:DHA1 family multidrug resistance protein-like MFS transporter
MTNGPDKSIPPAQNRCQTTRHILTRATMTAELGNASTRPSAATSQWSSDTPAQTNRDAPHKGMEDLNASDDAPVDEEKAIEEGAHGQAENKKYLVEFDGPDDIGNPKTWSQKKRWAITISMALLVFTVTFASSIFSVNIGVVQEKFNVTKVTATLGVALFVLVCSPALAVDEGRLT